MTIKKIAAAVTFAALLGLVHSAPAQQTLLGTCSGSVGVVTQGAGLGSVFCTPAAPPPPPAPTVTIAANPTTINPGQSSNLSWNSANATACAASGGWTGSESLSGTQAVSPAASATYALTCSGAGGSASASANVTVASAPPPSGTCSLTSPAFCETFNAGPVANNGRTGDLDPAKWTASRISGDIVTGGGVNPQFVAPIPACRSTFTGTMVYSPRDTLICDPSGSKTAQLMTAAAIQNYGTNNYMVLQPFDFAGRTGKIDFDVDAAIQASASGYPEIDITDQPVPAPTFREFNNFEVGSLPQNAIIVKFLNVCGGTTSSGPSNVMVYNNYVGTILTPTVNGGCVQTSTGQLNHFEIQLSQTQISIYGSDFSSDNATFPNYKLLFQADISLPFSRGYVHVAARNHATFKYAGVLDAIYHWDNIGFDGPVIPALRSYEIPDNTTVSTFTGDAGDPSPQPAKNLGYLLIDAATGRPAGMYDPVNLIPSLSFQNVNLAGAASAQLTFNAWFNASTVYNDAAHIPTTAWGISYSLNGAPFTTVNLTAAQIAAMLNNDTGYQGFFTPVVNVPLSALVQGTNTIKFLPVGAPIDFSPVIANINLLLTPGQQQTSSCGLILGGAPIFCEPFDVVNAGIPSRTGDLDPNVWGVSRFTSWTNFSVGMYNGWTQNTPLSLCDGTTPNVLVPRDVQICNGTLREATADNPSGVFDNGNVLALAMYPKQPFDFAGRTGTVAFDVSNDTHATHAAWPEFWLTDLPTPVPFGGHFFNSFSPNSLGIRLGGMTPAGGQGGCPTNANADKPRWSVDSAIVVRNYVYEDANYQGYSPGTVSNPPLTLTVNDCVVSPPDGSGVMNHVEFRISQSQIEVWASDAGVVATPATLKKIATITNANLSFTRGLIWMVDAHYNADKGFPPSQRSHTFVWDNVAFDGPFTYRDFSYDALDAGVIDAAMNTVDLGKLSFPGQTSTWNVAGLPANPQGTAARVLFNFENASAPNPTVLNVTVNGHAHSVPWPYPDSITNSWRSLAVTIPLTDLVVGTNVVQIGSDQTQITSNVNIVLVNVPGGVPVLPGNSRAYPN